MTYLHHPLPARTVRALRLVPLVASLALPWVSCSSSDPVRAWPAYVASVSLAPANIPILKGSRSKLTLSARDSAGNEIYNAKASWSSSAPLVASVADDGTVTAVDYGTAMIKVQLGERSAYADVVVTSAPTARMYSVLDLGTDATISETIMRQLSDSGDVLAGKLYRGGVGSSIPGCSSAVTINGAGHVLCRVNSEDSVSSYAIWRNGTLTPLAATDTFKAQHFRAFAMNDSDEVAGLFFMPTFGNVNCPANGVRCLSVWKNGAATFPGYDAGGADVMLMNNRQQAVVEYAMWTETVNGSVIYHIPTATSRQTQYGVQAFNENGWGAIASPWIAHGSSDLFRSRAYVTTPTSLVLLGNGKASGINDSNVVTGTLTVGPFIWRGSGISLLTNASVDPTWSITAADEINSRGQILAKADNSDGRKGHTVILTPTQP